MLNGQKPFEAGIEFYVGHLDILKAQNWLLKDMAMQMVAISSRKLCAIGYDRQRILQVQLDDGNTLQYNGVGEGTWSRLRNSSSPWSFYRDNIEEEVTVKNVSAEAPSNINALEELF
jgi:hypothetical protein